MTEWDKLWNDYGGPSVTISDFQRFDTWVKRVKAEGDKLQAQNKKLKEAPITHTITIDTTKVKEALEALAERVSEIETELEAKLEAIRRLVSYPQFSFLTHEKLISEILEVLGG